MEIYWIFIGYKESMNMKRYNLPWINLSVVIHNSNGIGNLMTSQNIQGIVIFGNGLCTGVS